MQMPPLSPYPPTPLPHTHTNVSKLRRRKLSSTNTLDSKISFFRGVSGELGGGG